LTNVSGTLYFLTYDGQNQFELWKSDGSDAGTVRVANVRNGVGISPPGNLINVNGTLYFTTQNENRRIELWKSDGTEAGTVYVSDIGPQATESYWIDYKTIGGKLFFSAEGGVYGRELFVLDPNAPTSADYNRDHVVDSADHEFWSGHLGETSGVGLQADGNGNSVVDAADYVVWRKSFGQSPAMAASTTNEAAGAQAGEPHETSAIIAAGQPQDGGTSTNSGTRVQTMARDDAIAVGSRRGLEPSPSPSLQGRGKAGAVAVAITATAHYKSMLAELLTARSRPTDVEGEELIGPLGRMHEPEWRESRFRDALDEAFESCRSWEPSVALTGLCVA
jgi:ELWxxDGT repeat protein